MALVSGPAGPLGNRLSVGDAMKLHVLCYTCGSFVGFEYRLCLVQCDGGDLSQPSKPTGREYEDSRCARPLCGLHVVFEGVFPSPELEIPVAATKVDWSVPRQSSFALLQCPSSFCSQFFVCLDVALVRCETVPMVLHASGRDVSWALVRYTNWK